MVAKVFPENVDNDGHDKNDANDENDLNEIAEKMGQVRLFKIRIVQLQIRLFS